jgi:hypothetical protein
MANMRTKLSADHVWRIQGALNCEFLIIIVFSRPASTLWVNMMARGGKQGGAKTTMGQRIVAILPYIKQVSFKILIDFKFNTFRKFP